MGPCAGGAVYSPALTDFIFMVKGSSYMFVTGPDVVKSVTSEDVSQEDLGGASVHSATSGVCHYVAENEADCMFLIRKMLGYIPQNNMEDPPFVKSIDDPLREDESLDTIIPENPNKPYDIKEVITRVVDNGEFFRDTRRLRAEHRRRLCPTRWAQHRHCGESTGGVGGRVGY